MTDKQDDIMEESTEASNEESLVQDETLEVEEWQDELPPEDDFHDHDDFEDEVALDDEELDDLDDLDDLEELPEEEAYEDVDQEEARKTRGRNMFYGIIGVGALVVGGIAYMQFADNTGQQASRPITSLLNIQEIKKAPVLAAKNDQADGSAAPQEIDMVALYKAGKPGQSVDLPLPGTSNKLEVKQDAEAVISSDVMVSERPVSKLPIQTTALPKEDQIEKIEKVTVESVAPVAPAPVAKAVVEVAPQPSPELEKRLTEVTAQLDALKASLDKATQENAQLVSKMETLQNQAAQVQAPAPAVEPSAELTARVAELEGQLAAKDEELKVAKAAKVVTKIVKAKVTAKKAKAPKKKVKATPRKPKIKWVLRAATPNSAWIAPSSHSKELRSVAVGDVVPGLGRVKKISQKGQKWQVIGTKGTVQ